MAIQLIFKFCFVFSVFEIAWVFIVCITYMFSEPGVLPNQSLSLHVIRRTDAASCAAVPLPPPKILVIAVLKHCVSLSLEAIQIMENHE